METLLLIHFIIGFLSIISGLLIVEYKYARKGLITSKEQSEIILHAMFVGLIPILNAYELYRNIIEIKEMLDDFN